MYNLKVLSLKSLKNQEEKIEGIQDLTIAPIEILAQIVTPVEDLLHLKAADVREVAVKVVITHLIPTHVLDLDLDLHLDPIHVLVHVLDTGVIKIEMN